MRGHIVSHARPELTLRVHEYSRQQRQLCSVCQPFLHSSVFDDDWFTVNSLRSRHAHDERAASDSQHSTTMRIIVVVYLNSHRLVNSRPVVFVIDPQLISYLVTAPLCFKHLESERKASRSFLFINFFVPQFCH